MIARAVALVIALPTGAACGARAPSAGDPVGARPDGSTARGARAEATAPPTVAPGDSAPGRRLALGLSHSCAIGDDGRVRCWGGNAFGQLGDGSTVDRPEPTVVAGLEGIVAVAAGPVRTCALDDAGAVWCWGAPEHELGGGEAPRRQPARVAGLPPATDLALGEEGSCARTRTGELYCWGAVAGTDGVAEPWQRARPIGLAGRVARVLAGRRVHCAVVEDGVPRCSGALPAPLRATTTLGVVPASTPVEVPALRGAVSLHGAPPRLCARFADGHATCWTDPAPRVALVPLESLEPAPGAEAGDLAATGLALGRTHACAIDSGHALRCWGTSGLGEVGTGGTRAETAPARVRHVERAVEVDVGYGRHTCARDVRGRVLCWGDNGLGQAGQPRRSTIRTTPTEVFELRGVLDVAAAVGTTCALVAGDRVLCWGDNEGALVAPSPPERFSTPVELAAPVPLVGLDGSDAFCAAGRRGGLYCWGNQGWILPREDRSFWEPRAVSGLAQARVVDVEIDTEVGCAVLASGEAACWGHLPGDARARAAPAALPSLRGVVELASGRSHRCARTRSGEVWCWGQNEWGQRGDGDPTASGEPRRVEGLPPAVSLAAGEGHTCAAARDGSLRCWGANSDGQLGDGSRDARARPEVVSGLPPVTSVAAHAGRSCAVARGGGVFCWGRNTRGELGDGTTEPRGAPVPVVGITGARRVTLGAAHACALLADGTVRCWGDDSRAQLGSGEETYVPEARPVVLPGR